MEPEIVDQYINHEINIALGMALSDEGATAKLKFKIPDMQIYPWEVFLELNFSKQYNPRIKPFKLTMESFDLNAEIHDNYKPRSILDLFRFMEYLREQLEYVETNIPILEKKFMHFRFRAKQMMDNSNIDKKQVQQNIQNTLVEAYNIVSQRGALQNLYKKAILFINEEITLHQNVNLRRMYGLRIIEQHFNPDLKILSKKSRDLLLVKKKLERILEKWQSIRIPQTRPSEG